MPTSAGTAVYDGDCGFCTTCATWLGARSGATIVPWQGVDLEPLGLTEDDVTSRVYWLDDQGRVAAGGAPAVAAALRSCRGGWPLLGRLIDLPPVRPLAAVGYGVVARNRGRLPGATASCRVERP